MLHRKSLLLFALGVVCAFAPSSTQAAPLDAIPDSASVVIRLKSPEATIRSVVGLVNQLNPQWGALVEMQSQGLGMLISNPAMAGVDRSKDWWVVVFTTADAEPGIVFMVPTTDADAMKGAVGSSYQSVDHENHVLYSQDGPALDQVKALIGGTGQAIATVIDAESQSVLDRGDLSAFANVAQLAKTYAAQLDQAELMVDQALGQISQAAPEVDGMNMEAVFDMYGELAHALIQMVRDSTGYSVAVTINQDAVIFEEYLRVVKGSAVDGFFQIHTTADLALMDKLPANQPMYFGAHGDMKSLAEWGASMMTTMYEGNDDMQKAIESFIASMGDMTWGSYVGSASAGTLQEGLLQMIIAIEIDPIDKAREQFRDVMKGMGSMQAGPVKQEYTIEIDAEKSGDHSVDIMTMKQEITDPSLDPMGIQKKMIEAMYGPGGMKARLAYLPGLLVETVGGGKPAMDDALKLLADSASAASNEAVGTARQQMMPKANMVFLLDLIGLMKDVVKVASESGQVPIPLPPDLMDGIESGTSYIGFAIGTEPQAARMKAVVPVSQIKGIATLVQKGMALAAQFQQPPQ
jgi:hypothetical protein